MVDPVKKFLKEFKHVEPGPDDKFKLTLPDVKKELKKITDVERHTGFLYFLIFYAQVSHPSRGRVYLREELYNWQWQAAQEFLKHTQIISLKSRQIGYSTIVGAYALWRALFFPSQEIAIISLGQRESTSFLKRIKFIYDHLPVWMKAKTSEFAKTSVTFESNNSSIVSLPNTEDPARGESLSLLIADEFSAFKNQQAFLGAAIPTTAAGMTTPFSNTALPSQFFIISTLPRNPMNNEYLRILHGAQENKDSEYFLIDPTNEDIPHYQDENWHKKQRESLGERLYLIEICKQEVYDIENSLVPAGVLKKLIHKNPIRVDFLKPDDVDDEGYYKDFNKMLVLKDNFDPEFNYVKGLWVWEDPIPEMQYCLVADVGTGKADDWSAFHVFRLDNFNQVMEFKGKPNLEQYKQIIEQVVTYYNMAKLSIERTGLGEGVVSYFADTLMYENLYWHQQSKHVVKAGFPMSITLRATGISLFAGLMTKGLLQLNSVRTINEIRGFGYTKTGRIQGINTPDDLVLPLCQLAFLIEIGWAASDKIAQQHLIFGHLVEEAEEQEKKEEENKTIKYFEENFDSELDEESKDFLRMATAAGVALPIDLENLLNAGDKKD